MISTLQGGTPFTKIFETVHLATADSAMSSPTVFICSYLFSWQDLDYLHSLCTRSWLCMLNRSATDNQVMDTLISLVPDFVLNIMKGKAGIGLYNLSCWKYSDTPIPIAASTSDLLVQNICNTWAQIHPAITNLHSHKLQQHCSIFQLSFRISGASMNS